MEVQESVDLKTKVTDSVVEVFDTMLSMSIELADQVPEKRPTSERIVGAVNFAGEVMGLITIDVSKQFSQLMTAGMLDVEVDEIEGPEPVKDLLGEISNIVGGNLKSAFTDAGYDCSISTPSITEGSDFSIESLNMKTFERFVFHSGPHEVWVEVGVKTQKEIQDAGTTAGQETDVPKNFEVIGKLDLKTSVSESLTDVFDTMLSIPVEIVDEVLPDSSGDGRMVGAVNFTGEIMGIVTIGVPDSFSRLMTATMQDIEVDEIESDDEIKDLIGEISNIVGGGLKSVFTDAGVVCRLSPPSITVGSDFKIESLNMESYDRFAFRFQEHTGVAEVGIKGLEALKQRADGRTEAVDPSAVPEPEVSDSKTQAPSVAPVAETSHPAAQAAPEDETASPAADDREAVTTEKTNAAHTVQPSFPPTAAQRPPALAPAADKQAPTADHVDGHPGKNLDFVLDIPLEISVELGRARMQLNDVLRLHQGSVVELAKLDGEPVDILANDKVIAKGEVVVENEKYGIRITEIVSRMDRIKSLK